jgi:hypothetical protein
MKSIVSTCARTPAASVESRVGGFIATESLSSSQQGSAAVFGGNGLILFIWMISIKSDWLNDNCRRGLKKFRIQLAS